MNYFINPDIRKASTLPAEFYRSEEIYQLSKEKIFAKCWHLIGDTDLVKIPGAVHPFTILEGYIDEPLLLTRDSDDNIHCLSNVCTHRGNILIENPDNLRVMQCRYHGRRFELNGCFKSMPECEDAENFPTERDNLAKIPFEIWNKFIFVSVNPLAPLGNFLNVISKRLNGVKTGELVHEPARSRDYLVKCYWALYVDNYLEGFHIPYVHSGLNEKVDYGSYANELYEYCNLQLAFAKPGEACFRLHETSPDYGSEVAAYYWWIFPNLMLNYYPWGLSINVVKPLTKDLTKVSFITYVSDPSKLDRGAGSGLDRVEREDEAIVEMVQKGVQSRFYDRGRYSPKREKGVHHFHSLLVKFLNEE
ncbi:MAG: aromatic ring-hydroxylating dioxygenase subunit alpha [Chlorobi bacterium]|nr:aromatic ring-hydroxylating dioxygenase subunit alpha [Chlorobiota bacterium]MCI0715581.1 aromatic ring-hydroxylating dioxygenase subunit alpha [Chlorobiota bacterium]